MKAGDRVAIYFFFDADGVVDDYNIYLLSDLKKSLDHLIVVVNGKLNTQGEKKLKGVCDRLIRRKNVGFDSWAYKAGLEDIGWDVIPTLGELIMLNHTNFGPVYPFRESFDIAESHPEWDFWGLTVHHKINTDPYGICEYGYLPEHVQSHFIAVRTRMLKSEAYRAYWDGLPEIHNYAEAVAFHEAKFTKHFADKGFSYGCTADLEGRAEDICYPLMSRPLEMVRDHRCPIFKRKQFYFEYDYFIQNTAGEIGRDLLTYLEKETDYPVDLVWQNLLRTAPAAELAECLQLMEILPAEGGTAPEETGGARVLMAMILTSREGVDCALRHLPRLPEGAGVVCAVPDEELAERFRARCAEALPGLAVACRTAPALAIRQRDYLSLFPEEIGGADFVCFAADGMDEPFPVTTGLMSRMERGFDCVLGGSDYAARVLRLFAERPRLGLLMVPPANHSYFYANYGLYWYDWKSVADKTLPDLGLQRVPQSRVTEPLYPADGFFWARGEAIKGYLRRRAEIDRALKSATVGDESHAMSLRCMYAVMAQDAGFYTSRLMSLDAARAEALNLSYYVRGFNKGIMRKADAHDYTTLRDRLAATGTIYPQRAEPAKAKKPKRQKPEREKKPPKQRAPRPPRQRLYDRVALGLRKAPAPVYGAMKTLSTPLRAARQRWYARKGEKALKQVQKDK